MKILFNSDSLIMGGAEKLAITYLDILCGKFEVELLINENNGKAGNILLKEVNQKIKYKFLTSEVLLKKIDSSRKNRKNSIKDRVKYNFYLKKKKLEVEKKYKEAIKDKEYDYLIDFCCQTPLDLVDEKTICWVHSTLTGISKSKKLRYLKRFKKAKKVIAITDSMKEELILLFPEVSEKIMRIYNPIDFEKINLMSKDYRELSLKEEKIMKNKYILSCSRLDENKDIKTLIKSYKILKDNGLKEKLIIVGDGPSKDEYIDFAKKMDLEKEIFFLGQKNNPYIWMKNCEVFVLSSKREGFGLVLVEAMNFSKIVVSTDCPVGPKEILENGKSGLLAELNNSESLMVKIEEALNKEKSKSLIEEADKRKEIFNLSKIKEEVYRLLEVKNV